ncbi:hypothetical protein H2200_010235 [Cladophialophora chaetospira]|uniref:Uncharacterized protein n=1 Tax=Cladophialophora chaetospira TaxID=386627 RepID=A0AA38X2L6_9EURO|nr:hypothetical protein H2200_010235 [Cladophialophora chaetospira]
MSSSSSTSNTSPVPTPSTHTHTPPSPSPAASIPKIWRNHSLERAHQIIPTTLAAEGPRHILIVENPARRRHSSSPRRPPARPPSPYIQQVRAAEKEAALHSDLQRRAVIESAHYPIYKGDERTDFIRAVDEWIWWLATLRADYNEEFHRHFGIYMRRKLCEYRKLLRRMGRLVRGLSELAALLRTAGYESEMPHECAWLRLVLDVWIRRAIKRFELVTLKDERG